MEFVELRGGLTLPVDVLEFALGLEARGIRLEAHGDLLKVTRTVSDVSQPDYYTKAMLSEAEVAFIRQWKPHLLAIAAYQAPRAA